MKNNKKQKRKPLPPFIKFCVFIVNIMTIIFLAMTMFMNVVPLKYYIIILIVVLLFDYITTILLIRRNKKKRVIGLLLSIILITLFGVGIYYENKTNNFLDVITKSRKVSVNYVVVTRKDSPYNNIKDIQNKTLGILNDEAEPYIKAKEKINKEISTNTHNYQDTYSLSDSLVSKEIDASLIEES